MAHRLHAQVDEIGGTRELDDGEDLGRALDGDPEPERHGDDLHRETE